MNKYKHLSEKARKLRSKVKMCLSKRSFETREAAYCKGQEVYQCKHCGQWHRTSRISKLLNVLRHTPKIKPDFG